MSQFPPDQLQGLITGGGIAGDHIRSKSWKDSGPGEISKWPASLVSSVNFIIQSSSPFVLFWGKEECYFFFNDAWHKDFSFDRENITLPGEPAASVFEGLWEQLSIPVMSVFDGKEYSAGREKNNLVALWNLSFLPVRGKDGNTEGVLCAVNIDKPERRSVSGLQDLHSTENRINRLDKIIEHSGDAVITLTPHGIISGWNRMAEKLLGYRSAEIIGQHYNIIVPAGKLEEAAKLQSETDKKGVVNSHITRRMAKGGRLIDVKVNIVRLTDSTGKAMGHVCYYSNFSEQKKNEQLLIETEERLRLILDASDMGIWELNLFNKDIRYSRKYLEILGYQEFQRLSHNELLTHIHPEDSEIRKNAMERAMKTGLLSYDFRVVWKDESVHWIESRGQVFYDENKAPVKIIGTLRDITERRTRVNELHESEKKFRLLADSVPQLIWNADADGNLSYFNFSFYEYTGITPKQIHKDGWIQMVHPDDRLNSAKLWAQSMEEGEPFLTEHRLRRYDGEYRWHLSRAVAQRDNRSRIQMWVGTSTDIHDQKMFSEELEKNVQLRTAELKKAVEELTKTNQELEQFAYVSSHDLQEPLRKIQTFSGILSSSVSRDPDSQMYLDKINAAAQRMSQLIKDLLDYSRLSKAENKFTDTDLNEILEKVKNDFEVLILQKKAIILSTRLPVIKAIPIQMNQLVYNLIGNSLKFCDKKPFVEVSVKTASQSELKSIPELNPALKYYHFMFKDNGIGFSREYNKQIFVIFQRLDDIQKYSGTGIGLAMCKKIVENHGGYIRAESEPGKGATFHVYLPY